MDFAAFKDRVDAREATVGVVGLGYVGLPLALSFASKGFNTVGFDIDSNKIASLRDGKSYIDYINADDIGGLVGSGRLRPTDDFSRVSECHAILLCVPTPLNKNREPDTSFIENTARSIAPHLQGGQLVVLESTTYPGTTAELLGPALAEGSELAVGEDFGLAYSPEREDPGNKKFNTSRIPKVVGADDPDTLDAAAALYGAVLEKIVPVSSTGVAEMTKLLENIFRSVNIALVNELKVLCNRMGLDVWEVIDAAATKPFGFMPFYPGPGLGGHCIPIDPFYLTWRAREFEMSTRFVELAGEINTAMPRYVVDRTVAALNEHEKALKGAKVLVLGIAYKRDVDDVRESPAMRILELLGEGGAEVSYHDPHVLVTPPMRKHDLQMSSVDLTDDVLKQSDAVIIVTDHTSVDYERVVTRAPLVIDTRNATRGLEGNVVKA